MSAPVLLVLRTAFAAAFPSPYGPSRESKLSTVLVLPMSTSPLTAMPGPAPQAVEAKTLYRWGAMERPSASRQGVSTL